MKRLVLILVLTLFTACAVSAPKRIKISLDELDNVSKPGEKHALLNPLSGKWKARSRFWFTANADPQESVADVQREWILDGRYIKETYVDKNSQHPFNGIGTIGYDKVLEQYQSTWIDSMTTGLSVATGKVNEEGNVFTFEGESSCPLTKGIKKYKAILKILSDDTTTYEMYTKDRDGDEYLALEIIYIKQPGA